VASLCFSHLNTGLLVVTDTLLEEVGLPLEGNHVHPLEGVLVVVVLGYSECEQKSISDEPYVLAHQSRVHTN
jgi:hypothetical protein